MLKNFVNPSAKMPLSHYLAFDYPVEGYVYRAAPTGLPNIDTEAMGTEYLYGKLGNPPKEQGQPCMREYPFSELEDPNTTPYQDQVVDIDRGIQIDHTGRLSGSFVKYIACNDYCSVVKIYASPSTGANLVLLDTIQASLHPQTQAVNVWFWKNPSTRNELLFNAQAIVADIKRAGLQAEHVYKLVVKWEFWEKKNGKLTDRMPISGFTEEVSFEVVSQTEDL